MRICYGLCPPIAVTDKRQKKGSTAEEALELRVEGLARELAETINAGTMEYRELLRETAVHVLREEVEIVRPTAPATAASSQSSNPFAFGIPLLLVGGVMIMLFPPVGLLLFAAAAVMMAWGLVAILLTRR